MSNLINRRGQGLVEYILIVTVMGIFAVTVLRSLSSTTRTGFSNASTDLRNALKP